MFVLETTTPAHALAHTALDALGLQPAQALTTPPTAVMRLGVLGRVFLTSHSQMGRPAPTATTGFTTMRPAGLTQSSTPMLGRLSTRQPLTHSPPTATGFTLPTTSRPRIVLSTTRVRVRLLVVQRTIPTALGIAWTTPALETLALSAPHTTATSQLARHNNISLGVQEQKSSERTGTRWVHNGNQAGEGLR